MLESYDSYLESEKRDPQDAARSRLDYLLNEAWEDEHYLDLFRDKKEVIDALSEDLKAHFKNADSERSGRQ
jgi:hypothetical protein